MEGGKNKIAKNKLEFDGVVVGWLHPLAVFSTAESVVVCTQCTRRTQWSLSFHFFPSSSVNFEPRTQAVHKSCIQTAMKHDCYANTNQYNSKRNSFSERWRLTTFSMYDMNATNSFHTDSRYWVHHTTSIQQRLCNRTISNVLNTVQSVGTICIANL